MTNKAIYQKIVKMSDSDMLSLADISTKLPGEWNPQKLNKYLVKLKASHRIYAIERSQRDIQEFLDLGVLFPKRKETLYIGTPLTYKLYRYLKERTAEILVPSWRLELLKKIHNIVTYVANFEAKSFIRNGGRKKETKDMMKRAWELGNMHTDAKAVRKILERYKQQETNDDEQHSISTAAEVCMRQVDVTFDFVKEHLAGITDWDKYKDEDDYIERGYIENELQMVLRDLFFYRQIGDLMKYVLTKQDY